MVHCVPTSSLSPSPPVNVNACLHSAASFFFFFPPLSFKNCCSESQPCCLLNEHREGHSELLVNGTSLNRDVWRTHLWNTLATVCVVLLWLRASACLFAGILWKWYFKIDGLQLEDECLQTWILPAGLLEGDAVAMLPSLKRNVRRYDA